jgi:dihydroorotate dehydrogenase (NAD+) catalytic subunit
MIRQDLYLSSPWMNAAGMLGPTPPPRWPVPGFDLKTFGAFVTDPVSLAPRSPAADRCMVPFPGGALVHSGLPGPGITRLLRKYAPRWAQSNLPVWVHLIGNSPDEIQQMVRRIEGREGVMAVELGLPSGIHADAALALVSAAYGELPLIVHLPLDLANEAWVTSLAGANISAVSLGAPRGTLLNQNGRPVSGRLYGPALLPLTLYAVQGLRRLGLPVIAGPGVYTRRAAQALLTAGSAAIQLDTVLWHGWTGEENQAPGD